MTRTQTPMIASLAQMKNRANSGHRQLLRAYADGTSVDRPGTPLSSIRGYAICNRTLLHWGCVKDGEITETGRLLLTHLEEQHQAWIRRISGGDLLA